MKKQKRERALAFARDIFFDIAGGILFAAGITLFAAPAAFAPGGVTGLALIARHYLPQLPIGICTLLLNVPIVLATWKLMGRQFFVKSLRSMAACTVFLDLVFPLLPVYTGDGILASLFAGALCGAGLVLIYLRGSSTGGSDFVVLSIRKKRPHLSVGNIALLVDGCIILLGGAVFGDIDAVLKGILMTVVSATLVDKILYGNGTEKLTMVITESGLSVANAISAEVERGSTLIRAIGAYTGGEKDVLLCVCSKQEAATVRRLAHRTDPQALVMFATLDEAYGLGFAALSEKH